LKSEKQLMSLINAAQVLSSTLDVDKVLDKLISEVINVIDGAHAVILFIYDPKKKKLVINNCKGFNKAYMQHIELNKDEGMTGKTFMTQKAQIFSRIHDTAKGMENIQPENQKNFHKALGALHHYPTSTICAPLLSKEGCLGVLTIDSFSEKIIFNHDDLRMLETFASQASIAVENAKLFTQQERSKRIHSELAKVSVSHQGLDQVTLTLSHLIHRHVCLFNEFKDFTAASSPEAEQIGRDAALSYADLFNQIILGNSSKVYEQLVGGSVFLFPITIDQVAIGVMAIFGEPEDELDVLDELAIDLANSIFAIELMGQERMMTDLYKYEGYLLEQLLNHKFDSFTSPQRKIVGIYDNSRYLCVNIKISNQLLPFQELSSRKQLFNRLLFREFQKLEYKVLVLDRNMEYDILVITHDQKEEAVLGQLSAFFGNLRQLLSVKTSFVFHVGLGREFTKLSDIDSSYRDAKRCAEYVQKHRTKDVVLSYKELGIYRLFIKHDRDELTDYIADLLGPLLKYDQKHDTELVETLHTFLECQQNMTKTASKSFVHLNTIKYRLQKIKEILRVDKLEGKEMFELQLAIYLQDFVKLK
jgi:sugar diacid utilization regulator/putative methionine-R-sulfoxide reductase with GAF domain